MNKIRVIDLLNKIANGEEVPKKIKYDDDIYEYDYDEKNYAYFFIDHYNYLFDGDIMQILDDEVKILEEEKKIPNDLYSWFTMEYNDDLHEVIKKSNINFRNITEKLDNILDYLKSKGE